MSEYDELKKELNRVSHDVSKKHRMIQKISDELLTIEKEKDAARQNFNTNKSADYNEKFKLHLDGILCPIERDIIATRKELEDEDNSFHEDFENLTEEKFLEQCTDTNELLRQVQEMSSELRKQLQDLVGTHLYTNVSENLKTDEMKLDVSDLDRVITYFNECENKVIDMVEKPDYVGDFIRKIESGLQTFEFGTVDSKGAAVFLAVAMIALFVLLYKFVFPAYIVFICMLAIFHVFRTYSVYEILLMQKAIVDNIDSIKEKLREEAAYEAECARAELQQEHQEREQFLQQKLQALLDKKENAVNVSKDSFFYDSTSVQGALDNKLMNLEKKEADAISNRMQLQKELQELTDKMESIKGRMDTVFSKQQDSYLNYESAGESFVLDRKFLIDIDDVTKKLTFFDFPEQGALFIYREREEAINLIRLFNVQIRSRLHPLAYEVIYFDAVNLGQDCFFFVPETKEKNDPASRTFQIISDGGTYGDIIKDYSVEMRSRQKNFRQDGTIDAYNNHMLEIESLTIPYYFSFILDPEDSITKNLRIVISSAGTYGIYICAFVSEDRLIEMGASAKDLIDMFSLFYAVQNGKVNSRAKDFVLDTYCNKKRP